MLKEQNGTPSTPNVIELRVAWNPETQQTSIHFDPQQFRNWEMVVAILKAGVSGAEFQLNLLRMQGIQQQAMGLMQEQTLRQKLKLH